MSKVNKSIVFLIVMVLALTMVLGACSTESPAKPAQPPSPESQEDSDSGTETAQSARERKIVVGVSQCHMNTPYRVALKKEIEDILAANNLDWELIFTDGQNNPAKQTNDVEDMIAKKVDIIIMSPTQAQPLAPVAKKVLDAGIPLILLDRTISTEDYTTFVGGDNKMIGEISAEYFAEKLEGKGKLVLLQGTLGASATLDREKGFKDTIAKYPDMEIIVDLSADYKRDLGMTTMEDILQSNKDIQAVFSMSDNMALGAIQAIEAAGRTGEMMLIGADGQKEAFDKIIDGTLTGSVLYPTGAEKAIEMAVEILDGKTVEKINLIPVTLVTAENVEEMYDEGF